MPRVVFIAGAGRSGTTLLHNLLGQVDGYVAVGELRDIWVRGVLKNRTCGCGLHFRTCPFWKEVMERAFDGLSDSYAHEMLRLTGTVRTRTLPLMSLGIPRRREMARLAEYMDGLSRLYSAIEDVSGCRAIIDSSKNPAYGYLLRNLAGIEPYFLHVVRDAPAVAYAWTKSVEVEAGVFMHRKSATASAMEWIARNVAAELFLRRSSKQWISIRYEDLVSHPHRSMTSILTWLGESSAVLPFTSSHEVDLRRRNHSVSGNKTRFVVGPVTLRADDQWREALSDSDRRTVKALTWPLRAHYGYLDRADSASG